MDTAEKIIKIADKKIAKQMFLALNSMHKYYVLKFRNCESYLYGKEQLIYFQEIRELLKYQKPIELVVKVIDQKDQNESYFPPLANVRLD